MCGIFGLVKNENSDFSDFDTLEVINKLFIFSQTRGSEAAGVAINTGKTIDVYKKAGPPKEFVKSFEYKNLFNNSIKTYKQNKNNSTSSNCLSIIGHSRLVTNGYQSENQNNQPVVIPGCVGIHNGIITNHSELWNTNKDLKKETDIDTEIFLKILKSKISSGINLKTSLKEIYSQLIGTASMAIFFEEYSNLLLSTNTGSLFYLNNKEKSLFLFASERFILKKIIASGIIGNKKLESEIRQLNAFQAINLNLENNELDLFSFREKLDIKKQKKQIFQIKKEPKNFTLIKDHTKGVKDLIRCKKCVLPETYPFIDFDENGVCRYCRNHQKIKVKGNSVLEKILKKYRSKDGRPDCIVALSGGRDSCYGLHYIKKELGMNPIAFTYDWGLVTDLARRNCARICGKLGVEHIIRTPNISKKRKFVRKNIEAWLKKPELGMIPLFMAGDKAFYHHARQLKKETNIKLVFFCTGNMIENCPYKFGFSGIKDGESEMKLTKIKMLDKIQLVSYYLKHFLLNPSYFNSSLFDTAAAYWHTFIAKDDFLYLYQYIDWNEDKVVDTIVKEYDWEKATDTKTTWRIGDGTASFYNYIYYSMAGFTEDDDMISNMIREGYINREEGMKRSIEFAKPRIASLMEYAQMIGLNYEETLTKINSTKKLY
ncbi:hypothetical protein OA165_02565 [Prochlorococcus sp. AH-736-A21]|nr:hypothetical protein [Prochlorococcus sp. AH-736-A21]